MKITTANSRKSGCLCFGTGAAILDFGIEKWDGRGR